MSDSPTTTNNSPEEWRGMTLDELRRARAKALIRRELGRASMQYNINGMKANVANNGWRALMFSPSTVGKLKKADYAFLAFKAIRWFMSKRRSSRRRR